MYPWSGGPRKSAPVIVRSGSPDSRSSDSQSTSDAAAHSRIDRIAAVAGADDARVVRGARAAVGRRHSVDERDAMASFGQRQRRPRAEDAGADDGNRFGACAHFIFGEDLAEPLDLLAVLRPVAGLLRGDRAFVGGEGFGGEGAVPGAPGARQVRQVRPVRQVHGAGAPGALGAAGAPGAAARRRACRRCARGRPRACAPSRSDSGTRR